jgi:hypothetical protein
MTNDFHAQGSWANYNNHEVGVPRGLSPGPAVPFSRTPYRSSLSSARPGPAIHDVLASTLYGLVGMLEDVRGMTLQIERQDPAVMLFQQSMDSNGRSTSRLPEILAGRVVSVGHSVPASIRHLILGEANNSQPNALALRNLLDRLIDSRRNIQNNIRAQDYQVATFPSHLHFDTQFSISTNAEAFGLLMDIRSGQTAPGPASGAAIAALPKKKIDDPVLGVEKKAECSVCLEDFSLGNEVTVLPCRHCFHGDCVEAWLITHDACPLCRESIMPKDAGPSSNSDNSFQSGQHPGRSPVPRRPHFLSQRGIRDLRRSAGDTSGSGSGNRARRVIQYVRLQFGGGGSN